MVVSLLKSPLGAQNTHFTKTNQLFTLKERPVLLGVNEVVVVQVRVQALRL